MKWGRIHELGQNDKLLYWVLMFVLQPYFREGIDHWLKDILKVEGGMSGDPGWSIEHVPAQEIFRVWGDPDMSGIEPAEMVYTNSQVRDAVRESLQALAVAHPEKAEEVREVIKRYEL